MRSKRRRFLRVRPDTREPNELRFVDEADDDLDALRGEVERVEVELVLVGQRAFHHELRHGLDEVEEEERRKEREALAEEVGDLLEPPTTRLLGLEQRERNRYEHKRGGGGDAHAHRGDGDVARYEQEHREHEEHRRGAERLRDACKVELIGLLQAPLVHVCRTVDELEEVHAEADRRHVGLVVADRAIQDAEHERHGCRCPALDLIGRERVPLVDIRNLEVAHAVVCSVHEQHACGERHGEHARLLRAGELRGHDGENRQRHAPDRRAERVPYVVAPRAVRFVFLFLFAERTLVDGTEQAGVTTGSRGGRGKAGARGGRGCPVRTPPRCGRMAQMRCDRGARQACRVRCRWGSRARCSYHVLASFHGLGAMAFLANVHYNQFQLRNCEHAVSAATFAHGL